MALGLLLHLTQRRAFGYGFDTGSAHESFLAGVSRASPVRRGLVLTLSGAIAFVDDKQPVATQTVRPSLDFARTDAAMTKMSPPQMVQMYCSLRCSRLRDSWMSR